MVAKATIFLDGDDTLWKMQELYNDAKSKFASLLNDNGIPESQDSIISKFDALDALRVKTRGLTPQRFTESMLITYSSLATEFELEYEISIEDEILNLSSIVEQHPQLYEDTIDSLEGLKEKFQLVLFTAGEKSIQKRKLDFLKKNTSFNPKIFAEQFFVPIKTEKLLQDKVNEMDLDETTVWVVGNSLRSDIAPALAIGAKAILVSRGTWCYDSFDIPPKEKSWFKVNTLHEAVKVLFRYT